MRFDRSGIVMDPRTPREDGNQEQGQSDGHC